MEASTSDTVKVFSLTKDAFDDHTRELLELTQSAQDPIDRRLGYTIYPIAKIVSPPYSPEALINMFDNDADFQAAVNTTVAHVCEVGVSIKHIRALNPTDPTLKEDKAPEGDPEQYARLEQFLSQPNEDFDFCNTVAAMLRDALVTGTGYLEFGRDNSGRVSKMWYARSLVTRASTDENLMYQIHGDDVKAFRRFGSEDEVGVIQQLRAEGKQSSRSKKKKIAANVELVSGLYPKDGDKSPEDYVEVDRLFSDAVETDDVTVDLVADDEVEVRSLTEILPYKIMPDQANSFYGRPIILGAIGEWLSSKKAKEWNLKFFDNNTVPPLCIVVKGSSLGADAITFVAENLGKHSGADQHHKLMIMQADEDTDVVFERLADERLNEGSFLQLRDQTTKRILAALRVPETLIYSGEGNAATAKEDARRYLETLIRPYQKRLETLFNTIIREQMGITDWGIKFETTEPDALAERANTWEILLRRGVMTLNEVRLEMGLMPVEGGDEAFITIPGTGTVLVKLLEEFAARALENKSRSDINPAGGAKTPEKGINPVFQTLEEHQLSALRELLLIVRQGDVEGKEISITEIQGMKELEEMVGYA